MAEVDRERAVRAAEEVIPESLDVLYRRLSPSVVVIRTFSAGGEMVALSSGFVVDKYGVAVTNAHALFHCVSAQVVAGDSQECTRMHHVGFNARLDLALVPAYFMQGNREALQLELTEVPRIGQEIFVIGNPRGLERTLSTGVVSGTPTIDGTEYIQISAPISPGSSGGPVFNRFGKVIGVACASVKEGQNLNLAIPIKLLTSLLDHALTMKPEVLSSIASPKLEVGPKADRPVASDSPRDPLQARFATGPRKISLLDGRILFACVIEETPDYVVITSDDLLAIIPTTKIRAIEEK